MYYDASRLLGCGRAIYLVATGAGAGLQKLLWEVPGISRVLMGAEFPYSYDATDRLLGFNPGSYCSPRTTIALAMEAYYRAYSPGVRAVGLGLTASVSTNREHSGDHRAHVATVTEEACWVHSITLKKDKSHSLKPWVVNSLRREDGTICDELGLGALLMAVGHEDDTPMSGKIPLDSAVLRRSYEECSEQAMELLLDRPLFTTYGKRQLAPPNGNGLTLFPGSFNPPHEGHLWMAEESSAVFHVTVDQPHKPAISVAEALQRARMLEGFPRMFTRGDPLYIDKARRFPGARILIGADAMDRMLDPKWGVDVVPMIQEFRQLGVKFLVADREVDGRVMTLHDLSAPTDICQCMLVPAQHLSMSSTKIRESLP